MDVHRLLHGVRSRFSLAAATSVVGGALALSGAAGGGNVAHSEVAIVRIDAGRATIVLWSTDRRERPLTPGRRPSWSPDGAMLAFERDGGVWVVRPDGTGARRVTTGTAPSWAPDGTQLVVVERGRMQIVGLDGGVRELAVGTAPAWSASGTIAFARDGDIYVVSPDATGVRQLTSGKATDADPAWSPDGSRLVFVRDGSVLARTPTPGDVSRSVARPVLPATSPSWSSDGRYVLFSSGGQVCAARERPDDGGDPPAWQLRRLTAPRETALEPAWRPGQQAEISFEPAALTSTFDCDAEPLFSFEAGEIDPGRAHPKAVAIITFAVVNETSHPVPGVWLTSDRARNTLTSVRPAQGACRRQPRVIEWECKLGTIAARGRVLVEARYLGRTHIGNAVYGRARDVALATVETHGDTAVDLDLASIVVCDIAGTPRDDVLRGTPGADRMCGFGGNDLLDGGGGWDELRGGDGDDRLVGGAGRDVLDGELGDDRLVGGGGRDTLLGGPGDDWIDGGSARDTLNGGAGNDRLLARDRSDDLVDGGPGRDTARIDAGLHDRVMGVEALLP